MTTTCERNTVVQHPAAVPESEPARPFAVRAVAAVVLARSLLLLAVDGRYGWHRDELYYFAAGHHLALGYIDFPPITPLLSALARMAFGSSLLGQRTLVIAAGGATTVVATLIARQLGGGRRAQCLTAIALGVGPMLLGSNVLFQTVSFDQVTWALMFLTALRALERPTIGRWASLGLAVGIGLETKYTIVAPLALVALGVMATPSVRRRVGWRGPLVVAGVAMALWAPNLWWQAQHHWASIAFFRGRDAGTRADNPPLAFVLDFLLLAGPIGIVLAGAGVRRLWRATATRAFAVAGLLVVAAFLVLGGKAYYAAPVLTLLVPAGAVAWETRGRGRVLVPVLAVALLLPVLPVGVPVLPEATMVDLGVWHARVDYAEEIGWPQFVDTVAAAYRTIPAAERGDTAVIASNYGEAGAIDLYGASRGLPAATTGHLTFALWPQPRATATHAVMIGFERSWLRDNCRSYRVVAHIENRQRVDNEESGTVVATCALRGTAAAVVAGGWGW